MATGATYTIDRVGIFSPKVETLLGPGEIGFINSGIKSVSDCKVGDTITDDKILQMKFFLVLNLLNQLFFVECFLLTQMTMNT